VPAVLASQVSYIVLHHTTDHIRPATFSLKCKQHTFKAKIPKPCILQVKGDGQELLQMKRSQLPLLINNATTGHKLQGSGVDSLFVRNWSYVQNWVSLCCPERGHMQDLSAENHSAEISKQICSTRSSAKDAVQLAQY
jgi:hypothetical protein